MHSTELQAQLALFTGSETFTRHILVPRVVMTEGAMFLAKAASAYWLIDAIASYQCEKRVTAETFQVWTLKVDLTARNGILTMTDGNSPEPIVSQSLDYTDFPLQVITLWLVDDSWHQVMMLPSEY